MNVTVDAGLAAPFLIFDKTTRTLTIDEGILQRADVGIYEVTVHAHYSNETYSEVYATTFTLTVVDAFSGGPE